MYNLFSGYFDFSYVLPVILFFYFCILNLLGPLLKKNYNINPGSYIQAAEKSFSLVRGGRAREAAALAFEKAGPAPDRMSYKNWAGSVIDNPALIETKVKSSTTQK